ncbi:MAG: hypothetical protein GIW94_15075 [Candidatus Eremiobacteraeota bacterium]|nr:hypothetical protein [Candidatus Eremiobacteraeota bacterium]MBC5821849.1 hypothetical protein [Candidatus Eremiobacteraeota bacterium]
MLREEEQGEQTHQRDRAGHEQRNAIDAALCGGVDDPLARVDARTGAAESTSPGG